MIADTILPIQDAAANEQLGNVKEQFSDFVLQAVWSNDQITLVCTGPSGETFSHITGEDSRKLILLTLEFHRKIDATARGFPSRKLQKRLSDQLVRLTEVFSSLVLRGEILDLLNLTIGQAVRCAQDVRIRVMLATEALNILPWEILSYNGSYLGLSYEFVRHPFVLKPVQQLSVKRDQIRALFVFADPHNSIAGRGHAEAIKQILQQRGAQLEIVASPQATHSNIAEKIFSGVDVLHILAHGRFNEYAGEQNAYLIVDGTGDRKDDKLPIRMLESFTLASPMQLVVLSACRSDQNASYSSRNVNKAIAGQSKSLAQALIRAGVPCVIGMSHPISQIGAEILTRRLYSDIAAAQYITPSLISKSMRRIRLELFAHTDSLLPSDWITPTLYSRSSQIAANSD